MSGKKAEQAVDAEGTWAERPDMGDRIDHGIWQF
jgi:hypothetical protein